MHMGSPAPCASASRKAPALRFRCGARTGGRPSAGWGHSERVGRSLGLGLLIGSGGRGGRGVITRGLTVLARSAGRHVVDELGAELELAHEDAPGVAGALAGSRVALAERGRTFHRVGRVLIEPLLLALVRGQEQNDEAHAQRHADQTHAMPPHVCDQPASRCSFLFRGSVVAGSSRHRAKARGAIVGKFVSNFTHRLHTPCAPQIEPILLSFLGINHFLTHRPE